MWYSVIRFFIEALRTDSLMFFDFKIAQVISVVMILVGIIIFIYMKIKGNNLDNLYNDIKNTDDINF